MAVLEKYNDTLENGPRFGGVRRITARAWIFLIVVALLAPIWTVRYPPIVDYPNHLASAFVLAHLNDPSFHFSSFYAADWNANPYLAMDVILVGLQRLMPIEIAGRVLLSLCVLVVPAAAWFFLRRANPREQGCPSFRESLGTHRPGGRGAGTHESLALWSLAITQNLYFFLWGMLNLQLSLALCLLVLGVWLQYLERPRFTSWCLLLVMTTALYFTHLMGFGIAGWVMTAYAVFAPSRAQAGRTGSLQLSQSLPGLPGVWRPRRRLRNIFFSWMLFVPGALFFFHSTMPQANSGWASVFRWSSKLPGLAVAVTSGISPAYDFITAAILLAAVAAACIDNPDFGCNYRWLGVAASLFALYWILPARLGPGINADRRLIPFVFVLLLPAIRLGRRERLVAVMAILLFALRASEVEHHFVSAQRESARLAHAFSVIPDGARVLPLGTPSEHMQHFWAYGVVQRGWLSPCLFQNRGVQPLRTLAEGDAACTPIVNSSAAPFEGKNLRRVFDYVWAYKVPELSLSLAALGKVVYQSRDLVVCQLN